MSPFLDTLLVAVTVVCALLLFVAPFVRLNPAYQKILVGALIVLQILIAWVPLSGPGGRRVLHLMSALAVGWWVMQRRAGPYV